MAGDRLRTRLQLIEAEYAWHTCCHFVHIFKCNLEAILLNFIPIIISSHTVFHDIVGLMYFCHFLTTHLFAFFIHFLVYLPFLSGKPNFTF